MEAPGKKRRLEAPNSAGRQSVGSMIEGADLGDGIKLSMTRAELCEKCRFLPEVVTDNPVMQRFYGESMFSVFLNEQALAEAKQLFGENPYFRRLTDAHKSMILLLKHNIKTLDDWVTQPHPPGIDGIVRGILDAAALDANIRVLEVSRTEPLRRRDSPYQLPKGEDASAFYRAITQATYEAYTVATEGDNEEGIENSVECAKLMEPPGVMDAWRPDETLRVLTLNSKEYKDGWPCDESGRDRRLCVRKEDERIFRRLFGRIGDTDNKIYMREHGAYIVGSPGIGKTYMSCSFLWRLLTRDIYIPNILSKSTKKYDMTRVRKLRYILYTAFEALYLFDKETGAVTMYDYSTQYGYVDRVMRCYCNGAGCIRLYDCSKNHDLMSGDRVPTIAFSSPSKQQYYQFAKNSDNRKLIVDGWEMDELCAWAAFSGLDWLEVKERARIIGCIPRFLYKPELYLHRLEAVKLALNSIESLNIRSYTEPVPMKDHPIHVLMKMVREPNTIASYFNDVNSELIAQCIQEKAVSVKAEDHLRWCHDLMNDRVVSGLAFEKGVLHACGYPLLFSMFLGKCNPLPAEAGGGAMDPYRVQAWPAGDVPSRAVLYWQEGDAVERNVLYIAKSASFPVIDAFVLHEGSSATGGTVFIGIQATLASEDAPTKISLERFKKIFDGITRSVPVASHIIVYTQPEEEPSRGIRVIQKCPKDADAEHKDFWLKFTQYHCCIDTEFKEAVRKYPHPEDTTRFGQDGEVTAFFQKVVQREKEKHWRRMRCYF